MVVKTCRNCGREFNAIVHTKNYCSEECKRAVKYERQKAKRKTSKTVKNLGLYEIVKLANDEGLTYGEYVQKYNL